MDRKIIKGLLKNVYSFSFYSFLFTDNLTTWAVLKNENKPIPNTALSNLVCPRIKAVERSKERRDNKTLSSLALSLGFWLSVVVSKFRVHKANRRRRKKKKMLLQTTISSSPPLQMQHQLHLSHSHSLLPFGSLQLKPYKLSLQVNQLLPSLTIYVCVCLSNQIIHSCIYY